MDPQELRVTAVEVNYEPQLLRRARQWLRVASQLSRTLDSGRQVCFGSAEQPCLARYQLDLIQQDSRPRPGVAQGHGLACKKNPGTPLSSPRYERWSCTFRDKEFDAKPLAPGCCRST